MQNRIILALDVSNVDAAVKLAQDAGPAVWGVKIGSELFTTAGPEIVRRIRSTGTKVFLDLKFHDIPNTVGKAVAAAVHLDVQMITIHTSGGEQMMRAAEQSAQETAQKLGRDAPLILGVTILTSLDSNAIADVGYQANVGHQVEKLASLAVRAGLRGLVCSPLEVTVLRQIIPREVQLITPGIRLADSPADDQKRTLTPAEAISAGANYLVVGRPIYGAPNPREAAERIAASIS